MTTPVFCKVDDKHVPLYRVIWVSDIPHFCGQPECQCEGRYEVRLELDESVWANRTERDELLAGLETWARGEDVADDYGEEEWS